MKERIIGLLAIGLATTSLAASEETLTLRLRAVPLRQVVWSLFVLTRQAYVVDGDVVGNVTVELTDVTLSDAERRLTEVGAVVGSGSVRRVSLTVTPEPVLRGTGVSASLQFPRPVDGRDFLKLIADVTGDDVVAPTGQLGRFSLLVDEMPIDDVLSVATASSGLEWARSGSRILVRRQADPRAPLLPIGAGGLVGHVAYRYGESSPHLRTAGIEGDLASEVRLTGLMAIRGEWWAVLRGPRYTYNVQAGQPLFDSTVESIDGSGVVVRKEDGSKIRWSLPATPEGIAAIPDDDDALVERGDADVRAGRFESGEQRLEAMLAAQPAPVLRAKISAAIADLRFAWSQDYSAHGQYERAVRLLEGALEIDRTDRPWQAAEDCNEIGRAWTALNEPERAVRPHQEALEIAQSGAVRNAPQPFSCVRAHERTPWIEADALDGLANAERARGRLREAAEMYQRALAVWKKIDDPLGRSTALTGLGLVKQGLGQFEEAAVLHKEALALPARHPVVRAIILNNLGSAQLALQQWSPALESYEEALGIYRRLEDRAGEGTALNNLGSYWEARSEVTKACENYGAALVASHEADDRRGEAVTRSHLERLAGQGAGAAEDSQSCRAALETPSPP